MVLPNYIKEILRTIKKDGGAAYITGGACRDFQMGREPVDFDIATDFPPERVKEVLTDYKIIPTGEKHGTVSALCEEGKAEITTFRTESNYTDRRHPDTVEFVGDLTADLARRDLTINAIAFDGADFVDPFDGIGDIKRNIIRAVGDPAERFSEDPLRILRAVRFAATLGFSYEEQTKKAISDCKILINTVSPQRVRDELVKILCGDFAERAIAESFDVISQAVPELLPILGFDQKNPVHFYDVLTHTLKSVSAAPPDPVYRLVMLFHDIGKPFCFTVDEFGIGHAYGHERVSAEMTAERMKQLCFDGRTVERVVYLVEHHLFRFREFERSPDRFIRRALLKHGGERLSQLFEVARADIVALRPDVADALSILERAIEKYNELLEKDECFTMKKLNIDGNDLLKLGFKKGPALGAALKKLLDEVSLGALPNEKDTLIERANRIKGCETD